MTETKSPHPHYELIQTWLKNVNRLCCELDPYYTSKDELLFAYEYNTTPDEPRLVIKLVCSLNHYGKTLKLTDLFFDDFDAYLNQIKQEIETERARLKLLGDTYEERQIKHIMDEMIAGVIIAYPDIEIDDAARDRIKQHATTKYHNQRKAEEESDQWGL